MKEKVELNREKIMFYFLLLICILCIVYYVLEYFLHGKYFVSVFANAFDDTFMDFFNSVNNAKFDPYEDMFSNYPALACLICKFFFEMIPYELREGNGFNLRNVQAAMIPFIIYNAVVFWFIQVLIREKSVLSKESKTTLSLILLLCAPIVFAVERGNLILLSFALTMFFSFFFDCKNKVIKEVSFMALAIAAAIKIYPAIFGLLLLKRKDVKEIARLVLYGVGVFIAPFFFYDGFTSLKLMIEALGYTSDISDEIGYGVNLSLYNIIETIGIIFDMHINDAFRSILIIVVAGMLILGFFILKKRWQESLCVTLLLIFLPKVNYYYVMIFMIIPIVEFLNECQMKQEKLDSVDYIVLSIFGIILIPWVSNIIPVFSGYKFPVSYGMLVYYLSLCCLVMIILYDVIKMIFKKKERISGIVIFTGTGIFTVSTIITAMIR